MKATGWALAGQLDRKGKDHVLEMLGWLQPVFLPATSLLFPGVKTLKDVGRWWVKLGGMADTWCCYLQEQRWRGGLEAGMPLPSIKGARYLSYIQTLNEQNHVTTSKQFFVPLHQMHTYLLLFYYINCARWFSGFAQHSSCPRSCTLPLPPPRGCSRPCWPWNSLLAVFFPRLLGMPFPWASFHGEMMVVTAQTLLESVLPVTPHDWPHSSAVSCLVC